LGQAPNLSNLSLLSREDILIGKIRYNQIMSDREIRNLERLISATDDPGLIIKLDHYLQRVGRAEEYYCSKLIEAFWEQFSLEDAFRGTQQHHIFFEFPDCLGALYNGCAIGVFLNPSRGVGWRPSISLIGGIDPMRERIAEALFPDDQARQAHLKSNIFQCMFLDSRKAGNRYIILDDLYRLWIEDPSQLSNLSNPRTQQALQEVNSVIRTLFSDVWAYIEECCENLRRLPYL
jgi:hypothetical protein